MHPTQSPAPAAPRARRLGGTKDAAEFLGLTDVTLRRWRQLTKSSGKLHGPPFYKHGKLAMYDLDELAAWSEARAVRDVAA